MKKILVFLLLTFLALNAFALKASVLDYDPLPAKAGEFVDVFISIENNAKGAADQVLVELVPKDSIRLAFGQEAVKDVGIIPGNRSTIIKYRLEITREAVDGENTFELKVSEGEKPVQKFDLSIEVENILPNIEIGNIESEPKKILPDTDDVKLTVTVLNTGDDVAQNLKTTLKLSDPLEFSDSFSNIYLIGNLAENSSSKAVFFIDIPKNTTGGKYKAQLVAEYTLKDSSSKEFLKKTLDFDIIVKPVPRFEITKVELIPAELMPGQRNIKLKLEIKNVGEAEAESVRVKVFQKGEQPFEFEKAFDFVASKLKPGETGEATLEFRIEDKANLQKYLVETEIKNFVDDTVRLEEKVVEINVSKPRPESPNLLILLVGAAIVLLIVLIVYWRRIYKIGDNKNKSKLRK